MFYLAENNDIGNRSVNKSAELELSRGRQLLRLLVLLLPMVLFACSSAPPREQSRSSPFDAGKEASSRQALPALPALPAAGTGRGGYYKDDGPGENPPAGLLSVPDALPVVEPYRAANNRPYTVFGKSYVPIVDDRPFKQRGIGSWYGKKFHGQKTSSGELYDMYKMTAAHPTLPIPSYARVTNLKTGAQVIVRINDRCPFHSNRIIDLSYTAALKLGYLSSGSSELEVERLLPEEIERMASARRNGQQIGQQAVAVAAPESATTVATTSSPSMTTAVPETSLDSGFYLQLGAYAQEDNARLARDKLLQSLNGAVDKLDTITTNGLYRLYAGPYTSRSAAQNAAELVREHSSITPLIVQR